MSRPAYARSAPCWCCTDTGAPAATEWLSAREWRRLMGAHHPEDWLPEPGPVLEEWSRKFKRDLNGATAAWADPHSVRARYDLIVRRQVRDEHFARGMAPLWIYFRRTGLSPKVATTGNTRHELKKIIRRCVATDEAISIFIGADACRDCGAPIGANPVLDTQLDIEALERPEAPAEWCRRLRIFEEARIKNQAAIGAAIGALADLDALTDGRGQPRKLPAEIISRVLLSIAREHIPPPDETAREAARADWRRTVARFIHDVAASARLPITCKSALEKILREQGGSTALRVPS